MSERKPILSVRDLKVAFKTDKVANQVLEEEGAFKESKA